MTAIEKKERTGKQIEVLPRGTISKKTDSGNEFELDLRANGEFSYSKLLSDRHPLIPGDVVKPKEVLKPNKSKKRRAVKGTSDALDYDDVMRVGNDLLWHSRQPQKGFYLILAVNTGLRVGDLLSLRHSDLIGKRAGDDLIITEQKTGKTRAIGLNEKTVTAYAYLMKRTRVKPSAPIFISQKDHVFATVSINRFLKKVFKGYAPVVSSHSLRKAFGKRVYEMSGKNDHALIKLSQIFGHSKTAITRRYLGISKQEIADIYQNL